MFDYLILRYEAIYYGFAIHNNKYIINKMDYNTTNELINIYLKYFMVERWVVNEYDIFIPLIKNNTISLIGKTTFKLLNKLPDYFFKIKTKDLMPVLQNVRYK